MWYHITVDKPTRFTLAQTHTPPGIVRAGCLRGRGAHNYHTAPSAQNGCGFCFLSRASSRGFAAPCWASTPPPLRAGGGWVIPRNKLRRKERTSRQQAARTRPPTRSPALPTGAGRGAKRISKCKRAERRDRGSRTGHRPPFCTKPLFCKRENKL